MITLIPAIDIIGGECVRLTQGDYSQKSTYYKDPLEIAKRYEEIGIKRLHVVDLDGAKESKPKNLNVLERLASQTSLDIQYGGGVKTDEAIQSLFDCGASRAICGTIAVKQPDLFVSWLDRFGGDKVILGADIKEGRVATMGWLDSSNDTIYDLVDRFKPNGLKQVICTDISKDGMLTGPTFELYDDLQTRYNEIDITISGGISSMKDIEKLNDMWLRSVIIGKAIYENRITFEELKSWLQRG